MALHTLTSLVLIAASSTVRGMPAINESFALPGPKDWNRMISRGHHGVYTGGPGVLVRNPFDGLPEKYKVTPVTLWSNDILVPSQLYPSSGGGNGNPNCPNDGWDGFIKPASCPADPLTGETGPWNYAQLGVMVGQHMWKFFKNFNQIQQRDWGYGVFYATDANSVDKRCRWVEQFKGYDCPGGWIELDKPVFRADASKVGAGSYAAGSPVADPGTGGGAGCHFEPNGHHGPNIDQTDAYNDWGANLVKDHHCQCNSDVYGKNWNEWVDDWIFRAKAKSGFEYQGWFGKGKAPSWAVDIAACWQSNPRDMIELQNALWERSSKWNNNKAPTIQWAMDKVNRAYWGWNEVPVDKALADDPQNWDAVVIKLPAAVCGKVGPGSDTVKCLSNGAQVQLEKDLEKFEAAGKLKPNAPYGAHPGSAIAFVREVVLPNGKFQTEFYCEHYSTINKKYQIKNTQGGYCEIHYHDAKKTNNATLAELFV